MIYISKRRQLKYYPLILIVVMFAISCIGNPAYGMATHIMGGLLLLLEVVKTTFAFTGIYENGWDQVQNEKAYAYLSAVEAADVFLLTAINGHGALIDYLILLMSAYYGFYLTIRFKAAREVIYELNLNDPKKVG